MKKVYKGTWEKALKEKVGNAFEEDTKFVLEVINLLRKVYNKRQQLSIYNDTQFEVMITVCIEDALITILAEKLSDLVKTDKAFIIDELLNSLGDRDGDRKGYS